MVNVTQNVIKNMTTLQEYAKFMYLEMIKSFVSATVYGHAELSVQPRKGSIAKGNQKQHQR